MTTTPQSYSDPLPASPVDRARHPLRLLGDTANRLAFGLLSATGPRLQHRALRAFFDWKYRLPDPWRYEASGYERRKRECTLELVPLGRYGRALEIGCAEGVFAACFLSARDVDEFLGIDIAARAIARARDRCARFSVARFQQADILETPPTGPFDIVFVAEILYYLGSSNDALARIISKLLAEDGLVVLVHPWPEAARLHGNFAACAGLRTTGRQVVPDRSRPFCVSVLSAGS